MRPEREPRQSLHTWLVLKPIDRVALLPQLIAVLVYRVVLAAAPTKDQSELTRP